MRHLLVEEICAKYDWTEVVAGNYKWQRQRRDGPADRALILSGGDDHCNVVVRICMGIAPRARSEQNDISNLAYLLLDLGSEQAKLFSDPDAGYRVKRGNSLNHAINISKSIAISNLRGRYRLLLTPAFARS